MNRTHQAFSILAALLIMGLFRAQAQDSAAIALPAPRFESSTSIEEALRQRRSVREYEKGSLALAEISQILWAAQGITDSAQGLRTAPSAGALYPLEVYLAAGDVDSLEPGVYRYLPRGHGLTKISDGDARRALCQAAWEQESVRDAPAVIIITAVFQRTMKKYGERGIQYAHIEVGLAAENIHLQAVALNLGSVFVGAFSDSSVSKVLQIHEGEQPFALIPIGRPK